MENLGLEKTILESDVSKTEKVVVIGATGQLASDIIPALRTDYEIQELVWPEFCIENREQVEAVLSKSKPDYVINTAAYHNVKKCEENPQQSFLINSTAVKYLAEICNKIDATLIHFSSDYVFGGDESRYTPYTESDLAGPVQVYGVSKLAGEKILKAYCKKYFCFRISGLYGIKGAEAKKYANFVEMMITLGKKAEKKGEKMPSAQDQILTFNPTTEIVKVIKKVMQKKTAEYGLYHATCEGSSSRVEFVREIFKLMGIKTEVYGVNSDYFKPTYAQPKFSVLENTKLKNLEIFMPHWKDALKIYLGEREKYLKNKK
ncbi:MAG: SDR family oxidoreductase [Promethearchaeota archaeon]